MFAMTVAKASDTKSLKELISVLVSSTKLRLQPRPFLILWPKRMRALS